MDRPANAPDPNHPLLLAARYNDADSEEMVGMASILAKIGIPDIDAFMYVVEQRVDRAVMLTMRGELPKYGERYSLSDREEILKLRMLPAYMDAVALGWRANDITRGEANDG